MATIKFPAESMKQLHDAFDKMTHYNEAGLIAARSFGQVADALHRTGIPWDTMGREVDRSAVTVKKYAQLYRRYPNEKMLLEASRYHDTFDITILLRPENTQVGHGKYGYQCGNCGSFDTHRKPVPADAA